MDIIEGAMPRPGTGLYVLGCYDSRITLYSQQVRALALIHALVDQGYLNGSPRIAVIGGGAAGLTAAAATALVTGGEVILFERADELLPLQSATERRHIDPHIFDWPDCGADDPEAGLPILDWSKGTARDVRRQLLADFEIVAQQIGGRLKRRTRHEVTSIDPAGARFDVRFLRDRRPGDEENAAEVRVSRTDSFDIVFLGVGFGHEPDVSIAGIANKSYWDDGGVPSGEFAGDAHPRFLVSGNGDGALIDFVAAASSDFSHPGMIQTITGHPGIDTLYEPLRAIDVQARAADAQKQRFDFIAAYDAEVRGRAEAIGLIEAIRVRLKAGVQVTIQTQHSEAFTATSATLNRLAAYLVMRACDADGQANAAHIVCTDMGLCDPPDPVPYPAQYWFDCGQGAVQGANEVIVRRGPDRAATRPFDNLLEGFGERHDAWLAKYGDATRVPRLSGAARNLFARAAKEAGVVSMLQAVVAVELAPRRVRVTPDPGGLIWSGSLAPDAIADVWAPGPGLEIALPAPPDAFGKAGAALLRIAAHSNKVALLANPGQWRGHAERFTEMSPQAQGMPLPRIENRSGGGDTQDPLSRTQDALAAVLHASLDRATLGLIHSHIADYCASGRDARQRIGVEAATDLRQAMAPIWEDWVGRFNADPALLARFLRLMISAPDCDISNEAAGVLVGPERLDSLVRGTAVALMIAAAWDATAPHGARPGNLLRSRNGGDWRGHGCGADMIDGIPIAHRAADFMWQTEFVILSVQSSLEAAVKAEEAFGTTEPGPAEQPGLDETRGTGLMIMTIDTAFRMAVGSGRDALRTLLETNEARHFADLNRAIIPGEEAA
jgi:hypothetical protein